MFQAIETARSGATVARTLLDVTADNVANINTVRAADDEPFRARLVEARAAEGARGVGRGVAVAAIRTRGGEPAQVFDPDHPLANTEGYVLRPVVDLAEEMSNLILAQRLYGANMGVVQRARDSYQQAIQIGRR